MIARLSSTEVKNRLQKFAKQFAAAENEQSQAQMFWAGFYNCFGISAADAAIFEKQVRKLDGNLGRIDSFIPGRLIVEHKSKGGDLNAAYEQAQEYFVALKPEERPKYIITSDFARIVLHDLANKKTHETTLAELPKHASWFKFLYGEEQLTIVEETPINRDAAYAISKLHEALIQINFKGRDLEIFLTRLLFCLFADDTNIFGDNGQFRRFVENARDDGSDTGQKLYELFEILNTENADRQSTLDDDLASFPYVNGSLFSERTRIPVFNSDLRSLLLKCATLDWSGISPAIFGAMFQGVLEEHATHESRQATRRELGAHYTSERNILRVINPLFMDELRAEFEASKKNKSKLRALYEKLPTLTFFDPACGCGNFLVIAYRELRKLENEVIAELFDFDKMRGLLDVSTLCRVNLEQFYGIEIDEAAAHIARVALYITDHQQNELAAKYFGTTRATIPLTATPKIRFGNALRTDWQEVLPANKCSYIFGNPPFIGAKYMTEEQRNDTRTILNKIENSGLLDYVCAWYIKSVDYIKNNLRIEVAFVSTNSITQGEQVGVLWSYLIGLGLKINFAHRAFQWSNEGKANAAVHCVIIGFSFAERDRKKIYEYSNGIKNEGSLHLVSNINPYLVEAANIFLTRRPSPICDVPEMVSGNKPIDDGNYLFTTEEMKAFILKEPESKVYFRRWLGGVEFINKLDRWFLWLGECPPNQLRSMPEVLKRVEAVRRYRAESKSEPTRKIASTPTRPHVEFIPTSKFLALPEVSSQRRLYIPIDYLTPDVFCSNKLRVIENAKSFHFSVLNSSFHMAWMRQVCGRLKSDYQYSASIVYNNFPWPSNDAVEKNIQALEESANLILQSRSLYSSSSLADLYDPLTMPIELLKAHEHNNSVVDKTYGYKGGDDDASRVAFLFKLYEEKTSLLTSLSTPKEKRTQTSSFDL